MKHALIVEGGAMRGIFAAGVLDTFQQHNYYPFDMVVGVSAGATSAAGYLAGNAERNRRIILRMATQKDFFNPLRFVMKGHMTDVKWLWCKARERYPLSAQSFSQQAPLIVSVTNMHTGQAEYHQATPDNMDQLMEATCALPVVYRTPPQLARGMYVDGGVADAIPVQYAYQQGCKNITVILSQPWGYKKSGEKAPWLTEKMFADYPALIETIHQRSAVYNQTLAFIADPPADCNLQVIVPPADFPVKRLTMNKAKLLKGYRMGRHCAQQYFAEFAQAA
ncbi:patatin-like phospholipase family protein [Alteromonas lipolytica]|uniref:Patatin family protein n=1 Tax=Alteromonas lipolytica TaxID=1856405 RepID=A0A1E8FG74_9ALTE|nr:patatin family protein [Alteromonas lipolytica]OFI34945.1 patatin family protein [Alteromonas lipolytica]GGF55303.1 patatin family protein [Alteromonas lipolytica]